MSTARLTEGDAVRAEALWAEYVRMHDVSTLHGQTVGVDPITGRIWIGESIPDVVERRTADGVAEPLHFMRIGAEAYYRKGGRR